MIRSETIPFCRWFLVPKNVIWKNHPSVAMTTDCFEPIFGFLWQFCFEKHRSVSWNRIGIFSEISGHSEMCLMNNYYNLCHVFNWKKRLQTKKKNTNYTWIIATNDIIFWKDLLENKEMKLKNGLNSIHALTYNGAGMVYKVEM